MQRQHRGVSLIEALVALGVMAFGMLGLVGLQSTMRTNADAAKQRSEAVRIAQEQLETQRGFVALTGPGSSYAAIDSVAATDYVDLAATNTTYSWTASVATTATDPPIKTLAVDVTWTDRSGSAQTIRLASAIAGIAPELAGALGTPATGLASRTIGGRNPVIPPGAVNHGDGTSRFTPPGSTGIGWRFDNVTGVLRECDDTFTTCSADNKLLLTGFIRFDQTADPPTADQTEVPISPSFSLDLQVNLTVPASPSHVDCFIDRQSLYSIYYCAMPVSAATTPASWSGTPEFSGFSISDDAADDHDDRMRVCRYTPERNNAPAGGNASHPLNYNAVSTPLGQQNYLIIRGASPSGTPYDCPGDGPSPLLNTNTYAHQPALAS